VRYRNYEKKKIAPLLPFGFALSYTTFEYGELRLSASTLLPEKILRVELELTNSGLYAGQEVVQLYIRDVRSRLQRPEKELKAFTKVRLAAGERRSVPFDITSDMLAYYDDRVRAWTSEPGEFEV